MQSLQVTITSLENAITTEIAHIHFQASCALTVYGLLPAHLRTLLYTIAKIYNSVNHI